MCEGDSVEDNIHKHLCQSKIWNVVPIRMVDIQNVFIKCCKTSFFSQTMSYYRGCIKTVYYHNCTTFMWIIPVHKSLALLPVMIQLLGPICSSQNVYCIHAIYISNSAFCCNLLTAILTNEKRSHYYTFSS